MKKHAKQSFLSETKQLKRMHASCISGFMVTNINAHINTTFHATSLTINSQRWLGNDNATKMRWAQTIQTILPSTTY